MVEQVKQKLAQDPNNAEGWIVLARTYYVTGRAPEAAQAYEKAVALLPADADILADYADALGVAQGRSLDGKPAELVERALKANPTHWKANALAGTIAYNRKNYAKAVAHWETTKAGVPPGSPIAQSIEGSIARGAAARRHARRPRGDGIPAASPADARARRRSAGARAAAPGGARQRAADASPAGSRSPRRSPPTSRPTTRSSSSPGPPTARACRSR